MATCCVPANSPGTPSSISSRMYRLGTAPDANACVGKHQLSGSFLVVAKPPLICQLAGDWELVFPGPLGYWIGPRVDHRFNLAQQGSETLLVQTITILAYQSSKDLSRFSDLAFPRPAYVTGSRRVEDPVNAFLLHLLFYLVMLHLLNCLTKLSLCTKLVPLSLPISLIEPRLAMKRRRARINVSDSNELATSKCTALLARQVKENSVSLNLSPSVLQDK